MAQLRDSLGSISWLSRALRDNDAPRGVAVGLAAGGGAGLITGHSGRAELTDLGGGAFYANCGTAGRSVDRVETRAGLPAVYAARLRCSWVELEAGSELRARLWHGARDLPERTLLERMASRERMRSCWPPAEVAEHPGTVTWPSAGDATARAPAQPPDRRVRDRVRRRAEPRLGGDRADRVPPHAPSVASRRSRFPRFAAALVAICGIGLLLLARGVRRGQRHAWLLANVLLLVAVVGDVTKGLDIEEAIIALLVVVLPASSTATTSPRPRTRRRGGAASGVALLAIAVAIIGGTVGVALRHPELSLPKIAEAVAERLVGLQDGRVAEQHRPARVARVARGRRRSIALSFCWLLFRPAVSPRLSSYRPLSRERARFIVEKYGVDSLVVLRAARRQGVVRLPRHARRVPRAQRRSRSCRPTRSVRSVSGPRRGARSASSPTSTVGPSRSWARRADWLPVYGASGMHDLYIGDEAVVDVRRFSLDGKQNKSLRQSVGRVEKAGYRVEFFDPVAARARDGGQAPRR